MPNIIRWLCINCCCAYVPVILLSYFWDLFLSLDNSVLINRKDKDGCYMYIN